MKWETPINGHSVGDLAVSKINYHPAGPTPAELAMVPGVTGNDLVPQRYWKHRDHPGVSEVPDPLRNHHSSRSQVRTGLASATDSGQNPLSRRRIFGFGDQTLPLQLLKFDQRFIKGTLSVAGSLQVYLCFVQSILEHAPCQA